ncbi:MAG: hypothetical protein AB2552_01165 [Candidatus Thiodiazotropha endolucinida]
MDEKELAIFEDAKNMANIAVWGVELQIKRLNSQKNEISEFVMQPVVDFHFLIVALTRLRQAASLVSKISDIKSAIATFDNAIPDLRTVRNILEHIDEYRIGKGNNKSVPKDSFQTIIFGKESIRWVNYEINLKSAMKASSDLYAVIRSI